MVQQIERNNGKRVDALDLAVERSESHAETINAELPPIALSDEMRKDIQSPIKQPDRINTLPVREKRLGWEL